MKETWNKYAARIDALVLRERLMVFGAAILVSVYLVFVLFIEPAQKRSETMVPVTVPGGVMGPQPPTVITPGTQVGQLAGVGRLSAETPLAGEPA